MMPTLFLQAPLTPGIRFLVAADVPACTTMLNNYLSKFDLRIHFTEADVAHWFLPRENIVYSWVVEVSEIQPFSCISFASFCSAPYGRIQTLRLLLT